MTDNGNSDFNNQPYQQSGYPQDNIYAQPGENRFKVKEILAIVLVLTGVVTVDITPYLRGL